jgi:hypothetical protein
MEQISNFLHLVVLSYKAVGLFPFRQVRGSNVGRVAD